MTACEEKGFQQRLLPGDMQISESSATNRRVLAAIALLATGYAGLLLLWPDALRPAPAHAPGAAETHTAETHAAEPHTAEPHTAEPRDASDAAGARQEDPQPHGTTTAVPALWAILPFVALLAAIAILPILPQTEHWWERNRNRFLLAVVLSLVTLLYYLLPLPGGGGHKVFEVLDHAILKEYVPFIVLLFSLYTISGGIRIEGDLRARPGTNAMFLAVGGGLASFVGTTGAAMLLIRPLLDTNDERKFVQHTVVFFIFVVCNCGGCLLPIGDPPLFLGYLMGVDFVWTLWNLWRPWLFVNVLLIIIYYLLDRLYFYPHETPLDLQRDRREARPLRISGMWPNALLLVGIILSVALLDPTKRVPGTNWLPWLYLREVVQLALVGLSLQLGSESVRTANRFNYHAIIEVAALFVGIFICMQPAIEILHVKGSQLGFNSPAKLFWATGLLSSVLDNAPTYVVFFETAAADERFAGEKFATLVSQSGELALVARHQLIAISLGAVFMGALTYIGNGPNFMVRAIAEQSGIPMPSFFGYVFRYSALFLIPVFVFVTFICL